MNVRKARSRTLHAFLPAWTAWSPSNHTRPLTAIRASFGSASAGADSRCFGAYFDSEATRFFQYSSAQAAGKFGEHVRSARSERFGAYFNVSCRRFG